METKDRIISILEELLPISESWIQEKDGMLFFVDPNDGEEISAHYGATHMAATLILYGKETDNQKVYQKGIMLLNSILERWDQSKTLPTFHFDFNNFALCVIADSIKDSDISLCQRIQQIVMQTADSSHNTTNWLPMRWFVNLRRQEWSGGSKYDLICQQCRKYIEKATNSDGGIEDRMPKGMSFNLQYDVATVSVLQFLRLRGVEYDLSKELAFLLNAVAPDGDINYQGRGTNQIFAWGLWVYLLSSAGREIELKTALKFWEPKVLKMYQNNNLILNDYEGDEKYLWWDYHYCSVYCAHFLFWLVLAIQDYDKAEIEVCQENLQEETGLHIYRTEKSFVATFDGRKEYLSERGPVVCAIWTKKHGMLYKGTFGPWQGAFGQRYSNETVLRNYCGLVELKSLWDKIPTHFLKKLLNRIGVTFEIDTVVKLDKISVKSADTRIELTINTGTTIKGIFNLPIMDKSTGELTLHLEVDGNMKRLNDVGTVKNQYGTSILIQSVQSCGSCWKLTIE